MAVVVEVVVDPCTCTMDRTREAKKTGLPSIRRVGMQNLLYNTFSRPQSPRSIPKCSSTFSKMIAGCALSKSGSFPGAIVGEIRLMFTLIGTQKSHKLLAKIRTNKSCDNRGTRSLQVNWLNCTVRCSSWFAHPRSGILREQNLVVRCSLVGLFCAALGDNVFSRCRYIY